MKKNFLCLKVFVFIVFLTCLLYFNFRANNNSARYVPVEFLTFLDISPKVINAIKSSSDKMAHFMVGFLLSLWLLYLSDLISSLSKMFNKSLPNISVCVFFLVTFFLLEFAQWVYREIGCGVDYACAGVYFSWLDVSAGFLGSFFAIYLISFFRFIRAQ